MIRVWFCNRRQKERRLQTIGCLNGDGHPDRIEIQQLVNGAAPGILLYTENSELPGYTIPARVSLKVNQDQALSPTAKTVVVEAEQVEGLDSKSAVRIQKEKK